MLLLSASTLYIKNNSYTTKVCNDNLLKKVFKNQIRNYNKNNNNKSHYFLYVYAKEKKTYEIFGFQKTLIKKVKQSLLF